MAVASARSGIESGLSVKVCPWTYRPGALAGQRYSSPVSLHADNMTEPGLRARARDCHFTRPEYSAQHSFTDRFAKRLVLRWWIWLMPPAPGGFRQTHLDVISSA